MLIEIINCEFDAATSHNDTLVALGNLLISFGEGKNYLMGPRDLFRKLASCTKLSDRERRYAESARLSQSEMRSLTSHLEFHVCADFSFNATTQIKYSPNVFTVPYTQFTDTAYTQATSLLTENSNECDFYVILAKYYAQIRCSFSCNFSYRSEHGGGSTIRAHYDRLVQEERFFLAIVDSDKAHPAGPNGSTARQFSENDFSYNGSHQLLLLPAREIECLLPNSAIEAALCEKSPNNDELDALELLNQLSTNCSETKLFFDHKKGLSVLRAAKVDELHGVFWRDPIHSIEKLKAAPCILRFQCEKHGDCTTEKSCTIVHGFGENIYEITLEKLRRLGIRKIQENLPTYLQEKWADIGRVVFSWVCSPKATRS